MSVKWSHLIVWPSLNIYWPKSNRHMFYWVRLYNAPPAYVLKMSFLLSVRHFIHPLLVFLSTLSDNQYQWQQLFPGLSRVLLKTWIGKNTLCHNLNKNKKPFKVLWSDCQAAKVKYQGHQPHFERCYQCVHEYFIRRK